MDIVSIMIFLIYIMVILMILIYISPILASLVLVLVPMVAVYLLPAQTIGFFKEPQFSFGGIYIQNLHILLLIWSAVIGVVASTEIMSWYLLRSKKPVSKVKMPKVPEKPAAIPAPLKPVESQKSLKVKVEGHLLKLGKIMSGRKG